MEAEIIYIIGGSQENTARIAEIFKKTNPDLIVKFFETTEQLQKFISPDKINPALLAEKHNEGTIYIPNVDKTMKAIAVMGKSNFGSLESCFLDETKNAQQVVMTLELPPMISYNTPPSIVKKGKKLLKEDINNSQQGWKPKYKRYFLH